MTSEESNQPADLRVRDSSGKFSRIFRRLFIVALMAIAGLYLLSMTANRPQLGISNGQLTKCPDSPNCVSTQATDPEHQMEAIPFQGSGSEMIGRIKQLVESEFPRASLVSESEHYLRYEFTSWIFRFVDDVEFFVDDKASLLHFRSASRVGHSDMGKNRNRMRRITEGLKK